MKRSNQPFSGDRFRRALRHFLLGRAAQALFGLGFTLATVRLLPIGDYGSYMVLWALIEFARPLTSLGLLPMLQQFLPEMAMHATAIQLRRLVVVSTAVRMGLLAVWACILLVAWQQITALLGLDATVQDPHLRYWVCLVAIGVLGSEVAYEMLEALLAQRAAQSIRGLFPALRLLGLFGLASAGHAGLVGLLLVDVGVGLFCLLLAELALVQQLRGLQPDGSRHFAWRDLLQFAWQMSVTQFFNAMGSTGVARLVVSSVLGPTAAGQFGFLQQLTDQLKRFIPSLLFANLVRPMLVARKVQGDNLGVAAAVGLLWKANALVVWPLLALLAIAGNEIVELLGARALAGMGLVALCLAAATASTVQNQLAGMLLQIYRLAHVLRNVSISSLLLPVAVGGLASVWGLTGAALGVAGVAWLRGAIAMAVLRRRSIRMTAGGRGLAILGAVTLATGALGWSLKASMGAAPAGALFIAVALALTLLLKPLSPAEFELLQKLSKRRTQFLYRFVR